MLGIRGQSKWAWKTSGSGGLGIRYISLEGGVIELYDPNLNAVTFYYGAVGVGLSGNVKLPKLPFKIRVPAYIRKVLEKGLNEVRNNKTIKRVRGKINKHKVGGTIAPTFLPSWGWLFILDTFKGDELSVSDINGACLFLEVSLGKWVGGAAYAMVLGIDPKLAALYLATVSCPATIPIASFVATKMVLSASSILFSVGANVSVGWSGAVYLGYLGDKLPHLTEPIQKYPLPERHRYPLPPRVPAQPLAHNRLASAGVRNTQNQNRKNLRHEDKHNNRPVIPKQQYKEIAPNVFQFNCPHPIFTDQPQLYINLSCKEIEEKEKSYGEN